MPPFVALLYTDLCTLLTKFLLAVIRWVFPLAGLSLRPAGAVTLLVLHARMLRVLLLVYGTFVQPFVCVLLSLPCLLF